MSETMTIACPACDTKIRVPASMIGKKVRCKACAKVFPITGPASPGDEKSAHVTSRPDEQPAAKAPQSPPAEEPKAFGFADEDSEDDGKAYGVTETDLTPRCPQCAAEMEEGAVVCLNCGFHAQTRAVLRTRKMKRISSGAVANWKVAGLLGFFFVLWYVFNIFYSFVCLPHILVDDWETIKAGRSRVKALADDRVSTAAAAALHPGTIGCFMIFWMWPAWRCAKIATERLIQTPRPPEVEES